MSQKTREPNGPLPPGSSESGGPGGLAEWALPALILGVFVLFGLWLQADPAPPESAPTPPEEAVAHATPAPPPEWTEPADGVDVLLRVVDRRWEPWAAQLTRGRVTKDIPLEGLRLKARPKQLFGRLGGERLAAQDWVPAKSDRWEEQPDGSFLATVLLHPGKPLEVQLSGPGAEVVSKVRCVDGDRRGVTCPLTAPATWSCACRIASRVAVHSDRWSVPWVAHRSRFEDGPAGVPEAVDACFAFPELPGEERKVVVIAPKDVPLESAKEADSRALAAGASICVRAPRGEPLLVGVGGTFSPTWAGREGTPPEGTHTWFTSPISDGEVTLSAAGGWMSWPVSVPGEPE